MTYADVLVLLALVLTGGCGKGDVTREAQTFADTVGELTDLAPVTAKVATEVAPVASATVATDIAEDVAAHVIPVVAMADTAAPAANIAPKVSDDSVNVASKTAAIPLLAPELAERIRAMNPGCVALGVDGRTILYIDEGIRENGSGRETWLYYIHTDKVAALQKWSEWPLTDAPNPDADEGLRTTLAGRNFVACKTVEGSRLNIPSAPPVRVGKRGATFDIEVKGQPARKFPVNDDVMGDLEVVEGYWAAGVTPVFVRLVPSDQPAYLNERVIRIDPALPEVEKLW